MNGEHENLAIKYFMQALNPFYHLNHENECSLVYMLSKTLNLSQTSAIIQLFFPSFM